MEDEIKKIIRQEFPTLMRDNLTSFQNLVVPVHQHNNVDSPPILATNIVGLTDFISAQQGNIFIIKLSTVNLPSPVIGMIAFDGVNFRGVDGSDTFKYIPASDGTTGVPAVAAGTVKVTINGVDYNLLFT